MAKTKKGSLQIDADFTEDTVGFALDSFLSLAVFPRRGFSIEPFSRDKERWIGADARLYHNITGFKPFYMQFKRPSAFPSQSRSKVINDRKGHKPPMRTEPAVLFFGLREKKPNHTDYQHNILYRWRQRLVQYGNSDAAYVCPLFLKRDAYRFHLHFAALRLWPQFLRRFPWDIENIFIQDGRRSVSFERVLVLREHVCIPPHKLVKSAKHKYSFTESGDQICFHSPEEVPEGSEDLASWIGRISEGFMTKDNVIRLQDAKQVLAKWLGPQEDDESMPHPEGLLDIEDGLASWLQWGDYLNSEFDIEQYAFVQWSDGY